MMHQFNWCNGGCLLNLPAVMGERFQSVSRNDETEAMEMSQTTDRTGSLRESTVNGNIYPKARRPERCAP
jgi:hypothetical protein